MRHDNCRMKKHSATLRPRRVADNCPGHRPHVAPDGEYVCTRCGAVLSDGYDWPEDESIDPPMADQAPNPKSNVSLFLAHKLGGSEVKSLPGLSTSRSLEMANRDSAIDDGSARKKKGANTYLSRFSNACSKLGLTHAESEHAWRLFARLYSELSGGDDSRVVNSSEMACYSIAAGAAATTRRVLGEWDIAGAVMFAFHSKSVRDMYHIRRVIETRSQEVTGIPKPALTESAKWMTGRY